MAGLASHRFSTVRSADLIVVMGREQVVVTGSHAQLTAAAGVYAELSRNATLGRGIRFNGGATALAVRMAGSYARVSLTSDLRNSVIVRFSCGKALAAKSLTVHIGPRQTSGVPESHVGQNAPCPARYVPRAGTHQAQQDREQQQPYECGVEQYGDAEDDSHLLRWQWP